MRIGHLVQRISRRWRLRLCLLLALGLVLLLRAFVSVFPDKGYVFLAGSPTTRTGTDHFRLFILESRVSADRIEMLWYFDHSPGDHRILHQGWMIVLVDQFDGDTVTTTPLTLVPHHQSERTVVFVSRELCQAVSIPRLAKSRYILVRFGSSVVIPLIDLE